MRHAITRSARHPIRLDQQAARVGVVVHREVLPTHRNQHVRAHLVGCRANDNALRARHELTGREGLAGRRDAVQQERVEVVERGCARKLVQREVALHDYPLRLHDRSRESASVATTASVESSTGIRLRRTNLIAR